MFFNKKSQISGIFKKSVLDFKDTYLHKPIVNNTNKTMVSNQTVLFLKLLKLSLVILIF